MNIFDYQKKSLDLISKSMGLPTFDELLENPNPDAEYEASRDLEDEEADEGVLGENMVGDPRSN